MIRRWSSFPLLACLAILNWALFPQHSSTDYRPTARNQSQPLPHQGALRLVELDDATLSCSASHALESPPLPVHSIGK